MTNTEQITRTFAKGPATVKDIADTTGLSTTRVGHLLNKMAERGEAKTLVYGDDMVLVDRQVCLNCSKEV